MFAIKSIFAISVVAALSACGGGGGGGDGVVAPTSPVVSTAVFSLQSAVLAAKKVSSQGSFTISGNCVGTGTENTGAANASTLYGSTYARSSILVLNYTNCTGSGAKTVNSYMNSSYNTIAQVSSDGSFSEATVINSLPSTVKVGDTLTLANIRSYSSSTKQTLTGTAVQSMVVLADTESSVLINVVTQSYDSTNKLSVTSQNKQRLTSAGALNDVSLQLDSPSGQKELWIYN